MYSARRAWRARRRTAPKDRRRRLDRAKLVVYGINRLLKQRAMGWPCGTVEVFHGARARKLERATPAGALQIVCRQCRPFGACPCRFLLLRFDRFRFPPSCHWQCGMRKVECNVKC
jgi:hypothetical protein